MKSSYARIAQTVCLIAMGLSASTAMASDFAITPTFTDAFRWSVQTGTDDAQINPTLYLARGRTYSFDVNTSGEHPFYIKTVNGNGSGDAYGGTGLSANGVTTETTITFDVPQDAPDSLFYDCGVHTTMQGDIDVVIFKDGFGD